jgi:hypothetical protein
MEEAGVSKEYSPPDDAKLAIIKKQNEKVTDYKDLHEVHTDRLIVNTSADEKCLLLLTPNLQVVIPRFVDHLPDPTRLATRYSSFPTPPRFLSPQTGSTLPESRMTYSPLFRKHHTTFALELQRPPHANHEPTENSTTLTLTLSSASFRYLPHPRLRHNPSYPLPITLRNARAQM